MQALPIVNERAAGIDVGSESMHVSVHGVSPKVYGTITRDLEQPVEDLRAVGVKTVAIEATGVYWLCLYASLEAAGIEVLVVNGRYVRNLPGRKTEVSAANGWRHCTRMVCCARASCRRRRRAVCRTISGCVRTTSP